MKRIELSFNQLINVTNLLLEVDDSYWSISHYSLLLRLPIARYSIVIHIFRRSLTLGYIPGVWRRVRVVFIPKREREITLIRNRFDSSASRGFGPSY